MKVFVIPVYNELPNFPTLIKSLRGILHDNDRVLFVNDGSDDGTAHYAASIDDSQFTFLHYAQRSGPGKAFDSAFQYLFNLSLPDDALIVTLEGDNTADLKSLDAMKLLIDQGADIALASVYMKDGGFEKTNAFRMKVSQIANLLARNTLSLPFHTLTSFYRIYRWSALQKIKRHYYKFCSEKGFICKVELLTKAVSCGLIIKETPTMLLSAKRKGKSKMRMLRTALDYLRFMLSWRLGRIK
jgi:glycosyltransferase involved in cell wall biosynthesis